MYNKILKILLSVFLSFLCGCGLLPNSTSTTNNEETTADENSSVLDDSGNIFGMWFSWVNYRDLCAGMSEDEFRLFVETAVSNMSNLGINTLYVHAVAFTDAFYDSDIYPRSSVMGDIDYDPLKIFVSVGHQFGMHVEAWINPMRSIEVESVDTLSDDFIIKQWIKENNERVRQNGTRYYLNPAYDDVRELICSVVEEIINNYDVDGIHMDDYFYPEGTETNFDAYIYGLAQEENESLELSTFRMNNVDNMVSEIYNTVKNKNSDLWFGISPSGNMQNNIELYYANPEDWVNQGTVDYLVPQLYWGFLHPTKPYESTLLEWLDLCDGTNVKLLAGLGAYNIGVEFSLGEDEEANLEWVNNSNMMAHQTEMALDYGCKGAVYYSYSSLFAPSEDSLDQVNTEVENLKSLISSLN